MSKADETDKAEADDSGLVDKIIESAKKRLDDPFLLSLLLAFCAFNWRPLYFLVVDGKLGTAHRITTAGVEWPWNFAEPFLGALLFANFYPAVSGVISIVRRGLGSIPTLGIAWWDGIERKQLDRLAYPADLVPNLRTKVAGLEAQVRGLAEERQQIAHQADRRAIEGAAQAAADARTYEGALLELLNLGNPEPGSPAMLFPAINGITPPTFVEMISSGLRKVTAETHKSGTRYGFVYMAIGQQFVVYHGTHARWPKEERYAKGLQFTLPPNRSEPELDTAVAAPDVRCVLERIGQSDWAIFNQGPQGKR